MFLLPLAFQSPQDTLRRYYEAAQARARAGDLDGAEAEYTAILGEGYRRLGKIYSAQKQHARAIQALETAVHYQPASEDALTDLAIGHFEAQQFEKALEPLRKALALNPRSPAVRGMLGKTHFALQDFAAAAAELETAVELAPDDLETSFTLAIAYLKQRRFADAKRVFGRMVQQFGDQPQLRMVIGRAYREAGLLPEAIDEFTRAAALDAALPRIHYNLGLAYLMNEGASRLDDAEREFKAELAANPDEYFASYYLGVVYIYRRQWELAVDVLQRASRAQPDNPDPYFQLGQAYQELEKHDRAVEALRKSIALNPDLAHNKFQVTTAHYRLAQSLLKTGQAEEGRRELKRASELKAEAFKVAQTSAAGASGMGAAGLAAADTASGAAPALDAKAAGELESAAAYYAKVVAAAHNDVGLLRAQRGDFRAAAEQFRLATEWNPLQEGLDYNLGLAYVRSESYADALGPLEREVKSHPENTAARWLLGLSAFKTRDFARASELLADVVTSATTNVDLYDALASSLIEQGKTEAAARVLDRMAAATGDTPRLNALRGRLEKAAPGRPNR